MKKAVVYWTPFALSRLDEIHSYILEESKSHSIASKFTTKIIDRTEQLLSYPESGQKEELLQEIGQNSRCLVISSYKVIYEYHSSKQVVIITDIFHTKQAPEKLVRPRR